MTEEWRTAAADVTWEGSDDRLDGEAWPEQITLNAWERNDKGERRIRASRTYDLSTPEQIVDDGSDNQKFVDRAHPATEGRTYVFGPSGDFARFDRLLTQEEVDTLRASGVTDGRRPRWFFGEAAHPATEGLDVDARNALADATWLDRNGVNIEDAIKRLHRLGFTVARLSAEQPE